MKCFDDITPDTGRYYLHVNKAGTGFTKMLLGKNMIHGKFQSAFKRIGIMNWQKFVEESLPYVNCISEVIGDMCKNLSILHC
jgi:hypothetical protein